MAVNEFAAHLQNVGNALEAFNEAKSALHEVLDVHDHNNYSVLVSSLYDNEIVTKAQYDAALVAINNLNTWLAAGNGTSIDKYLYEVPTP